MKDGRRSVKSSVHYLARKQSLQVIYDLKGTTEESSHVLHAGDVPHVHTLRLCDLQRHRGSTVCRGLVEVSRDDPFPVSGTVRLCNGCLCRQVRTSLQTRDVLTVLWSSACLWERTMAQLLFAITAKTPSFRQECHTVDAEKDYNNPKICGGINIQKSELFFADLPPIGINF